MIVLEKFNQIDKFGMVANFFIKFSDFVGSYKQQFFLGFFIVIVFVPSVLVLLRLKFPPKVGSECCVVENPKVF